MNWFTFKNSYSLNFIIMRYANYILFLVLVFVAENVSAQKFIKADDGIIVYPKFIRQYTRSKAAGL